MGIPAPYLFAAGLTAAVAGWMLSGDLIAGGREEARPPSIAERAANEKANLFRVLVHPFKAEKHVNTIEVRGVTEASGNVAIRTETTGLIEARHVTKGQTVAAGDLICSLKIGDREAVVQQRKAELKKATLDYENALTLEKNGYATRARINENKAVLEAASAALKSAEIEQERTRIKSPINGIVQDPFAKVGDMLQIGDICANIMQPETMTMIAQISERYIGRLTLGEPARVRTVTGNNVSGTISYIAPSANADTRSFRLEITLPNADLAIRDGVTALAMIDLPGDPAHLIPASVLTLNDEGVLGVRAVDAADHVIFMPVKLLDDTREGMWVGGLPDDVRLITRGQEYVVNGQKVEPVMQTAENEQ